MNSNHFGLSGLASPVWHESLPWRSISQSHFTSLSNYTMKSLPSSPGNMNVNLTRRGVSLNFLSVRLFYTDENALYQTDAVCDLSSQTASFHKIEPSNIQCGLCTTDFYFDKWLCSRAMLYCWNFRDFYPSNLWTFFEVVLVFRVACAWYRLVLAVHRFDF